MYLRLAKDAESLQTVKNKKKTKKKQHTNKIIAQQWITLR